MTQESISFNSCRSDLLQRLIMWSHRYVCRKIIMNIIKHLELPPPICGWFPGSIIALLFVMIVNSFYSFLDFSCVCIGRGSSCGYDDVYSQFISLFFGWRCLFRKLHPVPIHKRVSLSQSSSAFITNFFYHPETIRRSHTRSITSRRFYNIQISTDESQQRFTATALRKLFTSHRSVKSSMHIWRMATLTLCSSTTTRFWLIMCLWDVTDCWIVELNLVDCKNFYFRMQTCTAITLRRAW